MGQINGRSINTYTATAPYFENAVPALLMPQRLSNQQFSSGASESVCQPVQCCELQKCTSPTWFLPVTWDCGLTFETDSGLSNLPLVDCLKSGPCQVKSWFLTSWKQPVVCAGRRMECERQDEGNIHSIDWNFLEGSIENLLSQLLSIYRLFRVEYTVR